MPEALPFVGPALSIGGALFGGSKGGSTAPSGSNASVYIPQALSAEDKNLQALLNSNHALVGANNPFVQYGPQFQQAFQQLYNTPGTSGYTTGAANAGNAFTGVGNQSVGMSGVIDAAALAGLPGAQNVLNMGTDPQGDLYKKLLQQTTDASNVANAQYGLTGQQAAGNTIQADTNFNIDWQNQQLQRALAGLSGYNQSLQGLTGASTGAQNVGSAGAGSILSGGAAPYTAGQAVGANQETALTQLMAQLLGPSTSSESTIANLMQYLGLGVNAGAANANAQYNAYQNQLQGATAGAQGGAAIGNALAGLFNTQAAPGFSSGIGFGGSGGFGSGSFSSPDISLGDAFGGLFGGF